MPIPEKKDGSPRSFRAGLDRDVVVRAAVDLLNNEGLEALTINRLSRKLGVQPPSLYNHVDGLPGLRRELAVLNARLLGECLSEAAIGKSGEDGVRALAEAYRTYIKTNPGLYQSSLAASRSQAQVDPKLEAAELRVVQVVLAVISSFGLEGDEAIHAVRGLRSMVHGFSTLEVAGGFGLPLDLEESFQRLVEMVIDGMHR